MIQDKEFFCYDYFTQAIDREGNRFITYTHPDAFEAHMLELAGEDEKLSSRLHANADDDEALRPHGPRARRSAQAVLDAAHGRQIRHAHLRAVRPLQEPRDEKFILYGFRLARYVRLLPLWTLALMGSGDGGYPYGGSIPLAKSLEARYLGLGGKITYGATVDKILVENDKAVGIRLADGTEQRGRSRPLRRRRPHDALRLDRRALPHRQTAGLLPDARAFPAARLHLFGRECGFLPGAESPSPTPCRSHCHRGKEFKQLSIENRSFDKTLAPEGKSALCVMLTADYDYWAGSKGTGDTICREGTDSGFRHRRARGAVPGNRLADRGHDIATRSPSSVTLGTGAPPTRAGS
jgi:phytoene dehydrogenase-like protein